VLRIARCSSCGLRTLDFVNDRKRAADADSAVAERAADHERT
jgi:hypothetical protein